MDKNFLLNLIFLSLAFFIFLFLRYYIGQRVEIQKIKESLKEWQENHPDEEIFQEKIEFFLEEYSRPKRKWELERAQKILKEIQFFIQEDFLKKGKISSDFYEKLIFIIEKKRKEFAFY